MVEIPDSKEGESLKSCENSANWTTSAHRALVLEGQPLVVETEEVQDRGVEVVKPRTCHRSGHNVQINMWPLLRPPLHSTFSPCLGCFLSSAFMTIVAPDFSS